MGVLTHGLTQLRDEILALRSARQELRQDLERGARGRRSQTSHELASFAKGFAASSRRAKADRCGSISDLKHAVRGLLGEVRSDLRGIRKAWLAAGVPPVGAAEELNADVDFGTLADAEATQRQPGGSRARSSVAGHKPLRKKRKT